MKEKVKIVEHHLELLRLNRFGFKQRKNMAKDIKEYFKYAIDPKIYQFPDEKAKWRMMGGFRRAAEAYLNRNYEPVPDKSIIYTKNGLVEVANFDIICERCPNFVGDQEPCKLPHKPVEPLKFF